MSTEGDNQFVGKVVPISACEGLREIYRETMTNDGIWGSNIQSNVAAVLVALFEDPKRYDVALLVKMAMAHEVTCYVKKMRIRVKSPHPNQYQLVSRRNMPYGWFHNDDAFPRAVESIWPSLVRGANDDFYALAAGVLPKKAMPDFIGFDDLNDISDAVAIAVRTQSLDLLAYVLHYGLMGEYAEPCQRLSESFDGFIMWDELLPNILSCFFLIARCLPDAARALLRTNPRDFLGCVAFCSRHVSRDVARLETLFKALALPVTEDSILTVLALYPTTYQQEARFVPFRRLICETLSPSATSLQTAVTRARLGFLLKPWTLESSSDWQRFALDRWDFAIKTLGMKPDASSLLFAYEARHFAPQLFNELLDVHRVLDSITPEASLEYDVKDALYNLYLQLDDDEDSLRCRIFRELEMSAKLELSSFHFCREPLIANKLHTEKGREIIRQFVQLPVTIRWVDRGPEIADHPYFPVHGQCSTVEELRFVQEVSKGSVDWMAPAGWTRKRKSDNIVCRWLSGHGMPPHSPDDIRSLLETLQEFGVRFQGHGLLQAAVQYDNVEAFQYFVTKHKLHEQRKWARIAPCPLSQLPAASAIAKAIRANKIPPFTAADVPAL